MLAPYIRFFLDNKLIVFLLTLVLIAWGLISAPFSYELPYLPKDAVPVDAIPDIGENQQIVYTQWEGRSPQDIEDQISYPLTTALLGIPGVKSIRSNSMFGFSSIYVIFDDDIDFYWSRSRILEKLNALPPNTLPEGLQPSLGPDATALGQIFWYTLEGRDSTGATTSGWSLQELRSIQDYYVRYGLSAAEGVAEVASIGGYVKEYQVDVNPDALKAYNVTLEQVMDAIRNSNLDIGAQTLEINQAEYFVRGLGYIKSIGDIEKSVVRIKDNVPIRIGDIARVQMGPASRRGVLDKSGAEVVGGVVVARYGANPRSVIEAVKTKIAEIEPGLPAKTLKDGTLSQVKVIPFYDRTQLINETIGTLEEALNLEILITVIVVILMLLNLRSALLVSSILPLAVLMCFIAMRSLGVDANIVALSGIAIAIGTMVDMGIVLAESITRRLDSHQGESIYESVFKATMEVGSAVLTAVATTIISFLPVFAMEAAEGKLFRPLAYTKTFALIAAIILTLTLIPPLAQVLFSIKIKRKSLRILWVLTLFAAGALVLFLLSQEIGIIILLVASIETIPIILSTYFKGRAFLLLLIKNVSYALIVVFLLARQWMPLGVEQSEWINFAFVAIVIALLIGIFSAVVYLYEYILAFLLRFKWLFFLVIGALLFQGLRIYLKVEREFMPSLDEGSFLLMPTSMPHSGMQENIKNLKLLDMAVTAIPEVDMVVGKAGRVESALDPAPMSMYENVIQYKSEYKTDEKGRRMRFKIDKDGNFEYDEKGALIPSKKGRYYRQWRDHIKSPDDIWDEILKVTKIPGVTSAPQLQPIETRLVMLQTGMRAPMGIKVRGQDLETIEAFGFKLEGILKEVEGVKAPAVFAERIVGKPYLLIEVKRDAISRYGISMNRIQRTIQTAVGGMPLTSTVEGRERYQIRVRYPRELRNSPEELERILVSTSNGNVIPLGDLVRIRYEQGPQAIKSEDGFLVSYVLFDKEAPFSEIKVVNKAQQLIKEKISEGLLEVPPGVNFEFAGNYQQQIRANKRLGIVLPISLVLIFIILYLQFRSILTALMVFVGVFIAFSGGFILIDLYAQEWFLNFSILGTSMRDLFQIRPLNLSVAVWVGFLALFGIATDDGVLVATFLRDRFAANTPESIEGIRQAVIEGGLRRVRPAMMTTATTILALLPILTATGKGADIMLPMAIPTFGGMLLQTLTMFTVPVLYALWKESAFRRNKRKKS